MSKAGVYTAISVVLIFGMSGCAETELPPTLEQKLQGGWTRKWEQGGAVTTYHFDDGQCLTYAILPAQPVQFYAYSYTTEGDKLTMTDLATTPPFQDIKTGIVHFPTDSTAVIDWEGGGEELLARM